MAEDVVPISGSPLAAPEPVEIGEPAPQVGATPTRSDQARRSAYRGRFVVVYFCLAIVVGVAIGAIAVVLRSPEKQAAKPTPVFTPSITGENGAIELASEVQHTYRTADDTPFVNIVATRNTLQDGNLGLLRVRYQVIQPSDASRDRDSRILVPDGAIQYSLCGGGANCSIPGTATEQRGLLLRREALELAVRTLQNDRAVDNVVVFLRPFQPPQNSSFEGYVLMLNRPQVQRNEPGLLSKPIAATLPGSGSRITQEQMTTDQARRVDELTQSHLYLYRYQLIGGRDALMALQPA